MTTILLVAIGIIAGVYVGCLLGRRGTAAKGPANDQDRDRQLALTCERAAAKKERDILRQQLAEAQKHVKRQD